MTPPARTPIRRGSRKTALPPGNPFSHDLSRLFLVLSLATLLIGSPASLPEARAGLFKRVEPEPEDLETIVLAQIHLDELQFGPGKIDGRMGEFTRIAHQLYNETRRQEADNWFKLLKDARRAVPSPYTRYTVEARDLRYVGVLPAEPEGQEKSDYMYYRSLAELVAERFHTTEKFLGEINKGTNLYRLSVGDSLSVPNVTPFRIETVKKHQKFGEQPPLSQRRAVVDTKTRTVTITETGKFVANFPITPGAAQFIPYGTWKVQVMVTTPEFRWDKQMLEEGTRGEEFFQLPPGPNSPVGILWAGLNKSGIGLHGTSSPETIGRSQSAGCIRLANWDAIRLSNLIRPGATVVVQ